MKLHRALFNCCLIVIGALLGAFFCNYSFFEFNNTIDIFDVFALAITSAVGIFIAIKLGKAFNRETSEKELLISELKESIKILSKIDQSIESRKIDFKSIKSDFKSLNENLHLFDKLLTFSHCKNLVSTSLRPKLVSLRNDITSISPINRFIVLDSEVYTKVRSTSRELKQKYFELIFEINRL